MKKKIRKWLFLVAVITALTACFAFGVSALDATGQCGDNVYYSYDSSSGEFIISGEGDIDDWWDVHNVEKWKNIKIVIVKNGVTSLGKNNPAFSGCSNLKNMVLPEGITGIPSGFCSNCTELEEIIIPESCTYIGMEAFMGCTSLKNVVIPKNVGSINVHAFWGCTNLMSVAIQSDTLCIGRFAFNSCTNLSDVYYSGTQEQWDKIEIGEYNDELLNANIHFNHKHIDLTSDGICDDCTATVGVSHTHTYTAAVTKSPTCTATGTKTFTCSCGDTYTETIKAKGHTVVTDKAVAATCTKTGLTVGSHCSVCNAVITKQKTVAKKAHTSNKGTVTKKATYTSAGTKTYKCTACKVTLKTEEIKRLALSKVSGLKTSSFGTTSIKFTWKKVTGAEKYEVYYSTNGKKWTKVTTSKNSVTVKKLKSGTTYKVKVRAVAGTNKGSYSAVLTASTKPSKVTLSKLTAGKKKLTAQWKTVSGVTGYEVAYSTSKKFTKKTTKTATIKKQKTKKTTIKKLKKGKKYYVKVRAYKTVNGKKIYGAYSTVKTVKVK